MKTNLKRLIRAGLYASSLAAAALLFSGSVQTGLAVSADPDPSAGSSFTWDLLSSGSGQRGIAFITFSNDQTFHGFQLLASTPPDTNTDSSGRGGGGVGRGTGTGNSSTTNTFVFGFTPISGRWALNAKKQVVGFFSFAINASGEGTNYHAGSILETITNNQTFETTNITVLFAEGQASLITNFAWANPPPGFIEPYTLLNTNVTIGVTSAESTNAISFTGTAVAGKRLTLACSTSFGKVTYKGVPLQVLPDLSGQWLGSKREGGEQFNEFFSLVSFSVDNPFTPDLSGIGEFPNLYFTTNGAGPGYGFTGVAMLSGQKQVGFSFVESGDGTNGALRATMGNFTINKKGMSGKTKGILEPLNRITFDVTVAP